MKTFFGVLYALYGCAWAVLASRIENASMALFFAGLATLCLLAAGLAFFGGGVAWRIVHVLFGVVTLALWLLGSAWFLVHLFGWVRTYDMGTLGPLLGGVVGLVLTGPSIAYLKDLARWRRARATAAPAPLGGPSRS